MPLESRRAASLGLDETAVVVATLLYQLAMRDEMLPRLAPSDMPAAPPARTGGF